MTGKKLISISLITMLILSTLSILSTVIVSVGAYTPPSVPPHAWFYLTSDQVAGDDIDDIFDEADLTCTSFNVSVNIHQDYQNVTQLLGYEFKLGFNTTLLNATAIYKTTDPAGSTWGPIDPDTYEWVPLQNVSDGFVHVIWAKVPGLSTNFTGVTITFHIEMAPGRLPYPQGNSTVSCALDLYATVMGGPGGKPVTHGAEDGFYQYTQPQLPAPGAPVAEFIYPAFVDVCSDVTLTDASTPNGGAIVDRLWSITNVTGSAHWISADNLTTRTFHCDGPGIITVTLYVTDTEGQDDDVSHDIEQMEVLGPRIDLFDKNERQYPEGTWTPYDGDGLYADSDSYAPGENITLYANVTYNGDHVQNILVGFEVKDPDGEVFLVRTARTNSSGTATVWFRVPIPCDPEEQLELFGHWWAIAKCKLQDEIINDTKRFEVGWIIEITILETIPYDKWYKCEMITINVTLKNIAFIPRDVVLVLTVYDECDVPIGQIVDDIWMDANPLFCHHFVDSFIYEIHVPKWAYVGGGTVYANAFTHLPQDCGIPYCPEMSSDIYIDLGSRP